MKTKMQIIPKELIEGLSTKEAYDSLAQTLFDNGAKVGDKVSIEITDFARPDEGYRKTDKDKAVFSARAEGQEGEIRVSSKKLAETYNSHAIVGKSFLVTGTIKQTDENPVTKLKYAYFRLSGFPTVNEMAEPELESVVEQTTQM